MSDHGSGPRAFSDSALDITDMFVFPSPERSGSLVLVLNVFPFAGPTARFSDVVDYRFRIRPVSVDPSARVFDVGDTEYVFSCVFNAPAGGDVQEGTCIAPNGESLTFRVGEEGTAGDSYRVFAGQRMDPFFFDGPAVIRSIMTRQLAFTNPGYSTVAHQNVLSIVIECDRSAMFPDDQGPLFAVVGETAIAGAPQFRLERYGRPDIKNVVLFPKGFDPVNSDLEIRDLYNEEDAFALGPAYLGAFHSRMNANLAFWDGLDGKVDWPLSADGAHPLTELLLADFMVVDVSKPFSGDGTFFEIERAMQNGATHATCGGRAPNDDCMGTFMNVFVNAGNGPQLTHGIDGPAVPASDEFPYLVPPELNPPTPKLPSLGQAKTGR
ncbi:uncharacterized protein DUF4331 [Glaciihabitans tibetensis]|uniref:Uncharacterized protein DUF4331 n=1 Tax=Glaciihabitans tibetensis TaxID=1266600 RepID=A0A2T0V9V2_9MICO|nr:DUF4331 family protein [Glaciihabitans tibetensis]PRY66966.1 uncharacterized protein DUF4331 [Glaciihabitans tibetensis]